MIKAVIFDLNGIFIQSPYLSTRFENDFGVSTETFLPALKEIMDKVRRPNAGGSFQYWQPYLKEWNVDLSEEDFWKYWFEAETVSDSMVSFAKDLKARGIKTFLLSNNFKERAEYYGHYPWIHEVIDKAYFSWQTGNIKPGTQAWQDILAEHELKAEECLYTDDQTKNIEAAESIGIKSIMFTNEKELQAAILAHLD